MKIPTMQECIKLMDDYCLPENVRQHSFQVAKIAKLIADKFVEHGHSIDVNLVHSSALLHDILKPIDFQDYTGISKECLLQWKDLKKRFNDCKHPEAAYLQLKENYPEIALIIRKHAYRAVISDDDSIRPITWEEKIVTYADKRVAHTTIVSLEERFREGHKRWQEEPHYDPNLAEHVDKKYFDMEKEIFSQIPIKPEEIENLID